MRPITLDEKFNITLRAFELKDAGDREGYNHLLRTDSIPPYLVKIAKKDNWSGLHDIKRLESIGRRG